MSYPINYPTPQGANVQIFYAGTSDWVKPQGCSFVFALLVGAGGNGADAGFSSGSYRGGGGGGSGAVMTALIPAFLMPDQLRVFVPTGGAGTGSANATRLIYQAKDGTGYTLLSQNNGSNSTTGSGGNNGTPAPLTSFAAACIVQSSSGVGGLAAGSNVTAPSGAFLNGGAGGANSTTSAGGTSATNYGYPTLAGGVGTTGGNGRDGVSILSNLIVSQGGSGGGGSTATVGGNGGNAGFGSGGGGGGRSDSGTYATGGKGGDGLIVLISW